ncbi:MAG TPA: hypothetical protein VMH90_04780 [Thermoplasmata archaeon]|nr:hypothetical protein [Thermoplasmata archaeon]
MVRRTFSLRARIRTEDPVAVGQRLPALLPGSEVTGSEDGREFGIEATLRGPSARELNRDLVTALRRVARRTQWSAEWTSGGTTERFLDYRPKGTHRGDPSTAP